MKNKLHQFWKWVGRFFVEKKQDFQLLDVINEPDDKEILFKKVYHVGVEGNKWCIIFLCPCGCRGSVP